MYDLDCLVYLFYDNAHWKNLSTRIKLEKKLTKSFKWIIN